MSQSIPTSGAGIFAALRRIAPNIAFSVEHTEDPNYRWDGDGPDPAEDGYVAYDVDVFARAIEGGEIVEGQDSLGGVYEIPGEFDPDIGGYLPQMLAGAIDELKSEVRGPLREQALAADKFMDEVSHAISAEQQEERYKQRFRKKRWTP